MNEEGRIICEGWRNASVNPCVRTVAQCQVSASEWACVTAVSRRAGREGWMWDRRAYSKPDNRNVFMSMTGGGGEANKRGKH